jgi:hypothetical protein
MKRHRALPPAKRGITVLMAACAALIGTIPAYALWADDGKAGTPEFPLGTVAFGVLPDDSEHSTYEMSSMGAPLNVTIPGELITSAAQLTSAPESPVVFGFTIAGMSPTSVGLQYLISGVGQYATETGTWATSHPDNGSVWDGVANGYSLLAYSTVQIYPATPPYSGELTDCPQPPALPSPLPASNILVYDGQGNLATGSESVMANPVVISAVGVAEPANTPAEQYWCVAVTPNHYPVQLPEEGYYVNQFTATGLGCAAAVLDPLNPSAPPTCTDWQPLTDAAGVAIPVSDTEQWWVQLIPPEYPEPDLVLQIDPAVIHISPAYPTPNDLRPLP